MFERSELRRIYSLIINILLEQRAWLLFGVLRLNGAEH